VHVKTHADDDAAAAESAMPHGLAGGLSLEMA
jgi:hypothetical protein